MLVLKFGGTSVGSAQRIRQLASLIHNDTSKIVVLSAMSGTTNSLVEIATLLSKKELNKAKKIGQLLQQKYHRVVQELFDSNDYCQKGDTLIRHHFKTIHDAFETIFDATVEKKILAQGELLSTNLLHLHLQEQKINAQLLPALGFMRLDKDGEPDSFYIKENLERMINPSKKLYITQGFVARTASGAVSNLGRGGSDYTASLIGAALQVKEIQIWTDIDGMHNNDPRYIDKTTAIAQLSFIEAAELAYFGAKILHPLSIGPAKNKNIPVRLKNTLQPNAAGTLISQTIKGEGVKAIAAKDAITVLKIQSDRMLMAYGFMRHVFEVFERYQTPIDMVATSEVAVSISIDNPVHLDSIVQDLQQFGQVEIDTQLSIICIVGNYISEKGGIAANIFSCLKAISVRMISFGGSRHNISIIVKKGDKKEALKALHQLFDA
jgi:aspartate kinase